MTRSEKKIDLDGKEYTQFYDHRGRPTVRSYVETDYETGKSKISHYNDSGRKFAESRKHKDWAEKEYIETEYYNLREQDSFRESITDKLVPVFFILIGIIFVVSYIAFM